MSVIESSIDIASGQEQNIFGSFDANIKVIEDSLGIEVLCRNGHVKLRGEEGKVEQGVKLFQVLEELAKNGNEINAQRIEYLLTVENKNDIDSVAAMDREVVYHTQSGRFIKPKTLGQKHYVEAMNSKMITFGVGPAGTGKTYLAMAMAVKAFKTNEVSRIILTRPAIEAGEKLGFLPGDLQSKIDPYLRPLYDALYQIMGAENVMKNMEKGLIEVAPLAYMRGRTLDNAYIILDEAQNTTPAQMKMFLTRIGFGSKVIITGDSSQKDLPFDEPSGLEVAEKILYNIEDIEFVHLTGRDVVRHPLVQKIVKAYESYEAKVNYKNKKMNHKKVQ